MDLKFNGVEIAAYPAPNGFKVTSLKLYDGDASGRSTDGKMSLSKIADKTQIDLQFSALPWNKVSALMRQTENDFVDFTYPDPMTGQYQTKTFYTGDRPALVAIEDTDGTLWWSGVQFTLTEQ